MHKKVYISLATLTGLTLGTFWAIKAKKVSSPIIELTDDTTQDSYVSDNWSAAEKKTPKYKRLLEKWGTREGLIEVRGSNEISYKKKRLKKLKKLYAIQEKDKQLAVAHRLKPSTLKGSNPKQFQEELQKNSEVTQITITNNTAVPQKVSLWGANSDTQNDALSPIIEVQDFSTPLGVHPQNAIYNPANDLFYIANQLSDSLSIVDTSGSVINTLNLGNGFTGAISPVDLAVNTNPSNSNYGNVYVLGSVSNKAYEIDTSFDVLGIYDTGKRPIAIAFNTVNSVIYIANLASDTLTLIDVNSKGITTLSNFNAPKSIGIHQESGNIYIFNQDSQSITVLDPENTVLEQGIAVATTKGKFGYHLGSAQLYFSLTDGTSIIALDDTIFSIAQTIEVGNAPLSMAYNSTTDLLYVANRNDQTYSLISTPGTVADTIVLAAFDTGLAISSKEDVVLSTSINTNSTQLKKTIRTPAISFSEDYQEYREDFQHNPAVLQHLKVINSSIEKLNSLQFIHKSITGKETCITHSFRNYDSPQNFSNTSELYDLKGAIIDGRNSWCLTVPANQRITLLLYHKQFEVYDLLPETSRKAIGVQMSKGIPKHWN